MDRSRIVQRISRAAGVLPVLALVALSGCIVHPPHGFPGPRGPGHRGHFERGDYDGRGRDGWRESRADERGDRGGDRLFDRRSRGDR